MSTELRVLVAHLHELAAKQGEAAGAIRAATDAVDGAATSVRSTHGVIASSTAAAVDAAENARRTAGDRLEHDSRGMQQRLEQSAYLYESTDQRMDSQLDGQLRPK
jgi:Excreted virulence factor EspC, type VII ESX diderm